MKRIMIAIGAVLILGAAAASVCIWKGEDAKTVTSNSNAANEPAAPVRTFHNPLSDTETPDPSMIYKDGYYYFTFTHGGKDIQVWKSKTMTMDNPEIKTVWYAVPDTMYSAHIWAPELQFLDGRWYIYFAASDSNMDNHRSYALKADTDDPLGPYTFIGKITDSTDKWAIDGIVLEHGKKLYMIWSGWEGDTNIAQNLYIAPMSDPLTISGPRVLLSEPEYDWERIGGPPYINEGPAILKKDGRVFVTYSASGSWTPDYSLGMLALKEGGDPLDPASWEKEKQPVLTRNDEARVLGPGHNTFTVSPDGTEYWIVYHANRTKYDGWANRKARAQRIVWVDGKPVFARPVSDDDPIPVPSGSPE